MKRDYSMEAYERFKRDVDAVKPEGLVEKIIDFFSDWFLTFKRWFTTDEDDMTAEEIKAYERDILDEKDTILSTVYNVFQTAHELDTQCAAKCSLLLQDGQVLLKKLKELQQCAEMSKIHAALSLEKWELDFDTTLKTAITDQQLHELLITGKMPDNNYYASLVNASDLTVALGIGDAMLISLYQGKDIIWNSFTRDQGRTLVQEQLIQHILDGEQGYITVDELAKKWGMPPETARLFLEKVRDGNSASSLQIRTGPINFSQYNDKLMETRNITLRDLLRLQLEQEMEKLETDKAKYQAFSEELGLSIDSIASAMEGKTNGDAVAHYKAILLETMQKTAETQKMEPSLSPELTDVLDKMKEIEGAVGTVGGDALKKMQKACSNGIVSEAEINKIIKELYPDQQVSPEIRKALHSMGDLVERADNDPIVKTLMGAFECAKGVQDGMEKIDQVAHAVSYYYANYDEELRLLDSMKRLNTGNAEFQMAILEVEKVYTEKTNTIIADLIHNMARDGVEAVLGEITGSADTVIQVVGKVTGASDHAASSYEGVFYSGFASESVECYEKALEAAQADPTPANRDDLWNTFQFMKIGLSKYYDTQIDAADGMIFGIGEEERYANYLQYEKNKIDHMELGDSYEAMSYADYCQTVKQPDAQ